LTHLPDSLTATSLDVSGCTNLRSLPEDLRVRRLNVSGCTSLIELPNDLSLYELEAREAPLTYLPSRLKVEYRLDLAGCTGLKGLPYGLKTGSLILRGCTSLETLPEGLDVYFLDISGCSSLRGFPKRASIRIGRLNAAGCTQLRSLPSWLRELSQLDVNGCSNLRELPQHIRISSWLDLANTQIDSLPDALRGVELRWRGVPIDERIAFRPETITTQEILDQPNSELRRVLLERMGYESFLSEAKAQVIDHDSDPGGERRLLRVSLQGDEPLVCIAVYCPSTGRQYMLRVPPSMRSCHQAAAWIAGFDNADDYRPVAET
jgi:hypothetical protein